MRILRRTLLALSFALFSLSSFLFFRSLWIRDIAWYSHSTNVCFAIASENGTLEFNLEHQYTGTLPRQPLSFNGHQFAHRTTLITNPDQFNWKTLGFEIRSVDGWITSLNIIHNNVVTIPYWFSTCIFACAPALALTRRLRRRFSNPNSCPNCQYDLRAHAPGQKCPECGNDIPQPIKEPQENNT